MVWEYKLLKGAIDTSGRPHRNHRSKKNRKPGCKIVHKMAKLLMYKKVKEELKIKDE